MTITAYRHILWATDLTDNNHKVGERALELAQTYNARVSLLHVLETYPLYVGQEMVLVDTLELEETLEKRANERMQALADQFSIAEADAHVVLDAAKSGILDFATEHEVDLILIGSHSRKGLAHLLGSTARAVVNSASCDVLAVRLEA